MHVVATAGHVDHGKSTLVLALTGTDPDRFAEEKRRGLTIDLGFASTVLPSGRTLSFIDVPGHIKFLRNMLAGVGSVNACVFVVAATEGWKPQSEEHLRILDLLGIQRGIIAITKADAVDADDLELVQLMIADQVAGTFLADAPMVPVSSHTGAGMGELIAAIDAMLATTPPAADRQRARLWIDRVFAAKGAGTVVTGTLIDGSLAVGDHVLCEPGHKPARIRSIQTRHHAADTVEPGNRVAINLSGIDFHDLQRGDAVVAPDLWHSTARFDASLTVLASLSHDVSRRGAYELYIGSGEYRAKLRVLGAETLKPGTTGAVRLHINAPVTVLPGDRFIVRESGRNETVGGGEILDVAPARPASKTTPSKDPQHIVDTRGWVDVDEFTRLTGERRPATIGRWITTAESVTRITEKIRSEISASDQFGLDVASLNDRERLVIDTLDGVVVTDGRATFGDKPDPLAGHPYLLALAQNPFSPPAPDGVDKAELREMLRKKLAFEREGIYFSPTAIAAAARHAAQLLASNPDGFTAAQLRDALGTSRKYLIPLINELDGQGITRRRGDIRIGGPRLPAN